MNNGLRGRYMPPLEAWNNARRFAADLVEAYHDKGMEIHDVLSDWNTVGVSFPTLSELKRMVNEVLFLDGRDSIDKIARGVMEWDGWYSIEVPQETPTTPGVSGVTV